MAHGLKYYKEIVHTDGKVIRLEILEKDYVGIALEIGPVCQALCLDIQGDTEIDAPIVKTSLTMTFVDAPDHEDSDEKKCGDWSEFYTNDATYWQIVVKAKNAGETAFRSIWGGYVTPDSYNEILVYRGSVTIVARDNIGHLADFPFDAVGNADGMISLIELIREAWDKIESPMWLDDQAVANADWLMSEGAYAYDTYMNVSAFESKNWYDALESALYAYGLVMRYTGWNNVSFYSLRNMPRMGAYEVDDIDYREPVFESGAERELTPAVKRIEESVEYEIESDFASAPKTADFSGSIITTGYYNRELWPLSNTAQGKGWANADASKTLFVNPKAYAFLDDFIIDEDKDNIYNEVYMNGGIEGDVEFSRYINSRALVAELKLGRIILMEKNFSDPSSKWQIASALNSRINAITYAISIEKNGITKWLQEDGTWTTAQTDLTQNREENDTITSLAVTVPSDEFTGVVLFSFHIKNIQIDQNDSQKCVALYGLSIAPTETTPLAERNNVNTNYDNTNNVILSREPKLAPALNVVALPSIIRNGIFVKSGNIYNPAKTWYWGGQTPQQMAVYNHLQLLCYHAKPNNILRGTILNADITKLQTIWLWSGAEHIFVSGSINFLNGHVENAVLREFARYEDMWSAMLDPADLPNVDGGSVTNVESGSASKNEGARNTINTEVYLGGGNIVLDDHMSDSSENGVMNRVIKAYVDNLWHLDENGNLVTDKQVIIKNSLIVDGDTSSDGEGEDTPASGGIRGIYVNNKPYTDTDGDGFIDLGTISGGGGTADLSSYYTKAESDARYLASSLLGSNTLIHSGNIGSYAFVPKSEIANNTDADYLLTNGVYLNATGNGSGNSNFPQSYSIFATFAQSEKYLAQLSIGYNSFYFRRKIDTWDEWREVIHSGNIGSYAMKWRGLASPVDLNTFMYDAGCYGAASATNAPVASGYGAVLNMPYRRVEEKTDYMAQIFIPNGDGADTNMYYRTSLADSWNPWRKVISTADDGYIYGLGGYIDIQYSDEINRYGGNLYLQNRGTIAGKGTGGNYTGHILMCANGGYVGIGTQNPQCELDVVGGIKATKPIFGYMFSTHNNAAAFIFDKPGSNYTGIGSDGVSDTIRFGACDINGTWVSYNQKWKFYGDIIVTGDVASA